jgi:hypothetical protein
VAENNVARLPTQPYARWRRFIRDRLLMRVVGGGPTHPFHHHGQHASVLAVDGVPGQRRARSLCTTSSRCSRCGADRRRDFRWTGKDRLGIYGGSATQFTR